MKKQTKHHWMQGYNINGKDNIVYPLNPKPEDFNIEMIAHVLSLKTRFNGHCKKFYSVAQHCVIVSMQCSEENALWGLLHELDEVFLPDIPTPIKSQIPQWKGIAEKHMIAGAIAMGLQFPIPDEIKYYDLVCLATEKEDLMGECELDWGKLPPRLKMVINPLNCYEAEQWFMNRYNDIMGIK